MPIALFFCFRLRGQISALGPVVSNFIRAHGFGATALSLAWAGLLIKALIYPAPPLIAGPGIEPGSAAWAPWPQRPMPAWRCFP